MKAKLYTIQDGNLQEGMRIQDMPVPQLIVGNGVKIPINWPETGFTTSIERTAQWLLVENGTFILPEAEMEEELDSNDLVLIAWIDAPPENVIFSYGPGVVFKFFNQGVGDKMVMIILLRMKGSIIWLDGRSIEANTEGVFANVQLSQVYD
jgi:hypothetical protein